MDSVNMYPRSVSGLVNRGRNKHEPVNQTGENLSNRLRNCSCYHVFIAFEAFFQLVHHMS
jgi:hypothetical protein